MRHTGSPPASGSAASRRPAPDTASEAVVPAGQEEQPDSTARRQRLRRSLVEWPILIVVALLLALVIRTFLLQAFYIDSGSMEPTLEIDDRVLVSKVSYVADDPERGEVVVLRREEGSQQASGPVEKMWDSVTQGVRPTPGPPQDIIKRIVALPGETVELRDGIVYIDGVELLERPASDGGYIGSDDERPWGPETVPDDHYFMLGDNRRWSSDSRDGLGMIARDEIVGRAFVTIYPLDRIGLLRD